MMKRNRGRFTTILAVSGEKLPGSVVFPPTAAPLSPRCICRRQRSSITPGTLRVPWAVFFCTYKKQQAPQKRYLLFWQGQKGSNPRQSVLETDALQLSYTPIIKKCLLWWTITDSNRGPTGYEPVALTN